MAIGLTFSFVATLIVMHRLDRSHPTAKTAAVVPPPSPAEIARLRQSIRPVFPYSIVAGGVRSSDEVAQAMERDPVVADHYAKVRPADLREERIEQPKLVHASYRIGDKVFWTKKTLSLHPGEKVLTDGKTTIRERCGNLLTMEPLAPALEPALIDEPAAPEFDLVLAPWTPGGGYRLDSPPAFVTPPTSPGAGVQSVPGNPGGFGYPGNPPPFSGYFGSPLPPVPPGTTDPPGITGFPPTPRDPRVYPPPPYDPPVGDPPVFTSTETPLPVPEPSTWVLMSLGLVVIVVRVLATRRAAQR